MTLDLNSSVEHIPHIFWNDKNIAVLYLFLYGITSRNPTWDILYLGWFFPFNIKTVARYGIITAGVNNFSLCLFSIKCLLLLRMLWHAIILARISCFTVNSSAFLIWPTWKYVPFIGLLPRILTLQCVFCTYWRTLLWTKLKHHHSLPEGNRDIFCFTLLLPNLKANTRRWLCVESILSGRILVDTTKRKWIVYACVVTATCIMICRNCVSHGICKIKELPFHSRSEVI